jgi:C4-dicarboxylate transporter
MSKEPRSDPQHKPLFRAAHEALAEMALLYESHWKARDDIARTIISLSSAVVALTVTFPTTTQSSLNICWRYSYARVGYFLLLSILGSLASLWASQDARQIAFSLFTPKQTQPHTEEEVTCELATEVVTEIGRAVTPSARADVWARRLLKMSFVSFALGIMCIGIIGVKKALS